MTPCETERWEDITSLASLHAAARRALLGKRDRVDASSFFRHLEGELLGLQQELRDGSYQPGGYRCFRIRDPKPRLISAAPFRDRVVHQALVAGLEPIFERSFIFHSYASRTGRGTHRARSRFVRWARSSRFVLKMDVRKYFPSIDHQILKSLLSRRVQDAPIVALCDRIIDGSGDQGGPVLHFPGDALFTPLQRRRGLPIGNLTSQFFANVYLDFLDHFVKERLREKRYLRYMDDFCCFGEEKLHLRETRAAVVECLASLRLRLNEGKSRIRRVEEGIEFLGFVVLPTRLRLNATATRRQRRRIRAMERQYAFGRLSPEQVGRSLRAWRAHAASGTTKGLARDVHQSIRLRRASRAPEGHALLDLRHASE